jgi:hypothetical protein
MYLLEYTCSNSAGLRHFDLRCFFFFFCHALSRQFSEISGSRRVLGMGTYETQNKETSFEAGLTSLLGHVVSM